MSGHRPSFGVDFPPANQDPKRASDAFYRAKRRAYRNESILQALGFIFGMLLIVFALFLASLIVGKAAANIRVSIIEMSV